MCVSPCSSSVRSVHEIALRAEMVSYRYSTVYSIGYRVSRPRGAVDSGLAAVLAAVESVAVRVCRWI